MAPGASPQSSAFRSNIVSWYTEAAPEGHTVYNNVVTGSVFVVTFLQLINTSSNVNDAIVIRYNVTGAAVHSGAVGAGSLDRFPLVCELAVPPGIVLTAVAVFGTWDVTVSGYYTPLVASD